MLRATWQAQIAGEEPTVGEEEIAQVVAMWTGIPVTRIAQEEAISIVSKAVRRARAGLKDPKRPISN